MDLERVEQQRAALDRRLRRVRSEREARARAGLYAGLPTVPALFRHKDVLITGGSGFLGRVLIEKLLRSCPDVGNVYLLLRPRKGTPPADRIRSIVDVPLFDRVRREQPGALSKLVAVAGDCAELGLGLGAEDRALLQDRVAFVFHGAASVRFDDTVRKAVLLNTRGCRELVELCTGMRRLEALVHISTAFTNSNQTPIQERLYPAHVDWRQAIQYASDPSIADVLDNLGHKFLGFHPNTYTFSKALGEQVMAEAAASLPIVITRPAIVVGADEEPLPGWLDNINSPAALWMAYAKGVLRVAPFPLETVVLDLVPVDVIAKATILAAWATATKQDLGVGGALTSNGDCSVINMAISDVQLLTMGIARYWFNKHAKYEVPFTTAVRYPIALNVNSGWQYRIAAFFQHILFGLTLDLVLRLAGRKPRLMKVYRQLAVTFVALDFFMSHTFKIDNEKLWRLQELAHPDDDATFDYHLSRRHHDYVVLNLKGIMQYALKEELDEEKGLRHITRLFWIEAAFLAFLVVSLIYLVQPLSYLW